MVRGFVTAGSVYDSSDYFLFDVVYECHVGDGKSFEGTYGVEEGFKKCADGDQYRCIPIDDWVTGCTVAVLDYFGYILVNTECGTAHGATAA